MPAKSIDLSLCDGCGICADECPTEVFKMDTSTGKASLSYPEYCLGCKLCPYFCPPGAIEFSYDVSDRLCFPY